MAKKGKRELKPPVFGSKHNGSGRVRKAVKPPKSAQPKKPQPTIPFEAADRILLVGEGDLSFAKAIVEHHGCCDVTATTFDSQPDVYEKYAPQAEEHVRYLEEEGQTVLFTVDATKLGQRKEVKKTQWDVVIFNFPHVGGKSKDVNRQVRFNQELLVNFFKAAMPLLAQAGTIVITLFEGEPYTLWNIRDLARHAGLEAQRSFKFAAEVYPGYSHARTLGNIDGGGGWKGEDREARSYIFKKKDVVAAGGDLQKQQRARVASMKKNKPADEESSDDEG
ncbi:hypothetical protein LTR08_003379 [Meristemomyces frigidus]|nr:hypothetical protein LTR08_003379 [Meristemomyces frigidus]